MANVSCKVESRLTIFVARVGIRSTGEQSFDHLNVAKPRRKVQRSVMVRVECIRVSTRREGRLDGIHVSSLHELVERARSSAG